MKPFFTKLQLTNLNNDVLQQTFIEELQQSDVHLTFKWTANRRLVFTKLHLKTSSGTTDLLNGHAINTKTGNQTFYIGTFSNSTAIELSYGIMALVSVPKIVAILSQTHPDIAFQASPKDPDQFNKIDSGDSLSETLKYTVA